LLTSEGDPLVVDRLPNKEGEIGFCRRGRFVAALTAESTISFSGIPVWLGTQMKVMIWETPKRVMRKVRMLL